MKIHTLDEVQNELIGKVGTTARDLFENELQLDLVGKAIKKTRNNGICTRRIGNAN